MIERLKTLIGEGELGRRRIVLGLVGLGALTVVVVLGLIIVALGGEGGEAQSFGDRNGNLEDSTQAGPGGPVGEEDQTGEEARSPIEGQESAGGGPKGEDGGSVAGQDAGEEGSSAGGESGSSGEGGSTPQGDSTGVSENRIKWGVHAPETFNRAPVGIADPLVHGMETFVKFINQSGGIKNRAIELIVADDEYRTQGAQAAARKLIHDEKVFFISGVAGVDQIRVVAEEAKKAGVPYFGVGGNESAFSDVEMYQVLANYDTHVIRLAEFLASDPSLKGKAIGTLTSDSPLIAPSQEVFKREAERRGLNVVANAFVQKPEQQAAQGYSGIILDFKSKGVELVIPVTDPVNTSGLVRECVAQRCEWTYSFSNFGHEGDTALGLMAGEWGRLGVRGLASFCYQGPEPDDTGERTSYPSAYTDPAKCGQMSKAREWYEAIHGEGSWEEESDAGAPGYESGWGYQWVGTWLKAMREMGRGVTREGLVKRLDEYQGYSNLVTGPISYRNSPTTVRGAEKMVVLEAQEDDKYMMMSDGLRDGF